MKLKRYSKAMCNMCIYARSKAANSEIATVKLLKYYCLPYITYACEAVSFSKTDINKLDNLINRALCKIFNISNHDSRPGEKHS